MKNKFQIHARAEQPKPCNQEFRADCASIFLYQGAERVEDEDVTISKQDLNPGYVEVICWKILLHFRPRFENL